MAWHANVLVVATVTAGSDDLLAALRRRASGGPARFTLVMPAREPGLAGRRAVLPRLEAALEKWRAAGLECDGAAGSRDPMEAVAEIWRPGRFDEVIVSTLPGQSSRWLRSDLPHRIATHAGALVTHVVATDMRPAPPHGPPPARERSPLGVLAWGDPRR